MSGYVKKTTYQKCIKFNADTKASIQYIYDNVLFVHTFNEAINFAVWFCAECIKKGILPNESK